MSGLGYWNWHVLKVIFHPLSAKRSDTKNEKKEKKNQLSFLEIELTFFGWSPYRYSYNIFLLSIRECVIYSTRQRIEQSHLKKMFWIRPKRAKVYSPARRQTYQWRSGSQANENSTHTKKTSRLDWIDFFFFFIYILCFVFVALLEGVEKGQI